MLNIKNVKLRRRRKLTDRSCIKYYVISLNYKHELFLKGILCKKERRRIQEGFRVYSIKNVWKKKYYAISLSDNTILMMLLNV